MKIASEFDNEQDLTITRRALIEIPHLQPPTLVQVENTTSMIFIKGTLKEKRTKSMDMKHHRLKDRQEQKEFQFHWRLGKCDLVDPFIKHYSSKEHLRFRKIFNVQTTLKSVAQGYIYYNL